MADMTLTELNATVRDRVRRHVGAIERYASGETAASIENATGVNRRQLHPLLDRALSLHADG
ncbi:hypothetical protein [Paraburkholderia sp. RL17-373-BIF-A]|uniref:hypothetical protein n=1 Tax=Paraburkholderia sp. RL17-373-BIF-A TaxID=3031629 RepID=UPI0038B70B1A